MIVIAVMGLLTAGLAAMLTALLKTTKSRAAAENASVVQQALQRFVERSGRLPCPALPAGGTGIEDNATNAAATSCPATAALGVAGSMARGVVPWTTLGLPLEQVQDGYARMFTYNVTTAATVTTLTTGTIGGVLGNMTVHTATPAAMGLPVVAGRNQINSCWIGAGAPAATENSCGLNAVVILLSHGENGSGAVTSQGGALPAPTDAAEVENTDADAAFVKSDPTSTGFDDVLFAWSPDELIEPLARRLTVKSGAALSNETLRTTALAVSTAILNAATNCAAPPCGPGNWPTALIPTAPAIPAPPTCQTVQGVNLPTDAWGNCLVYANVTAGGTNICGTTGGSFTITSPGIDGLITVAPATNANTGRNDDFVITVTVDQIRSQLGTRFGAC